MDSKEGDRGARCTGWEDGTGTGTRTWIGGLGTGIA
jgi:hypothetical protein